MRRVWGAILGCCLLTLTAVVATAQTPAPVPATMISPVNGSTVKNPVTFTWTPGTGVTTTYLWVGTTLGGLDLVNFGGGTATSFTATTLPIGPIFVRLWSLIGGQLSFQDYSYTVAAGSSLATMISPTTASTVQNPVAFTWTPGTGVTTTYLWIGTTPGGLDLVNFGGGTATSFTATNLPVGPIFVRLWSLVSGQLFFQDYSYTVAAGTSLATMISPTTASTVKNPVAFSWTPGTGVTTTYLWIGTTPGGLDLVNFGGGTATSFNATNLPIGPIFVRLWSLVGGQLFFQDYSYTVAAGTSLATMISPANGTTVVNPVTFTWTPGTSVTTTYLWVGTTPGGLDLVNFGGGTATSFTATNLPIGPIFVRLWSSVGGQLFSQDYSYTVAAATPPPRITKTFGASSIPLNGTTGLSFTITNPAGNVSLTGVGFTDTLPSGMLVASIPALTSTCTGTTSAVPGSSTVSLSAATLAAATSCTLSVNVTGTTAGAMNNSVTVTSNEGGTGNTSTASLAVVAPPSLAEGFNPATIVVNGTSSLSVTITNPAANTAVESGVAFSDTLPAGLVIATPNGLTNSCGGTVTATAGTGTISLNGGSVAAAGSCIVTLNVTGTATGTFTNTTGPVSSTNGGTGNTASATLTLTAPLTVSVSPSTATVALSSTQLYTASGTATPVNWSVNGVSGGNATVGTISAAGLYTAPASFPGVGLNAFTITATSQANSTVTATASATVVYPNDTAAAQTLPIKLGTQGSNANNVSITPPVACCTGTLGSLWLRSSLTGNQILVLSNQHVLTNSGVATIGDPINQPGPAACFATPSVVANFTEALPVQPAAGQTVAPDNVDAGFAQIATGGVDTTGNILDLGVAGASSIAAAPPSNVGTVLPSVGLSVAKSGRTTGLTCSTISSINTSVTVDYDSSCGGPVAFSSTFTNQIIISNTGGSFAAPGDSGALIVTTAQARPVGLLFAGTSTTAVANPIGDVINALTIQGVPKRVPAIVGGPDHAVSCVPTATVPSSNPNGTFSTTVPGLSPTVAGLSAAEQQRVENVRQANEILLTLDPMISSVVVATSADSPGEGALEIHVSGPTQTPIPAVIGGVRTRVVYEGRGPQPSITQQDIDQASTAKEANVNTLLGQPGIQGVGVAISKDNPGETAIAIYTVKGEAHPPVPAVMNGVRTQVIEGERFRAF